MVDELAETLSRRPLPRRPGAELEARLVIVHPLALAGAVALGAEPVVFGRQSGPGAYALADATVSRQHALIRWDMTRHVVEDLGSRNGTHLHGSPLEARRAHPLDPNAVIAFGDVIAVYERGTAPGPAPDVDLEAIPGDALATRALRARIQQAAPDPAPVLLLGETGVGKEFIAREVHRLSRRRGPFIGQNVAELTSELVESQLFGHEKGAFTGADRAQPGLFRAAEGGTLFLDEIGELPLELQPKLLRVLQEGEIRPVGQTRSVKVDVRVVAATHRDIVGRVENDLFRRDLYARLAFWEIDVPPLGARRADIPMWIDRLRRAFAARRGQRHAPLQLEAPALEKLLCHGWPENLRGLDRVVHRLSSEATHQPVSGDAIELLLPRMAVTRADALLHRTTTPPPTSGRVVSADKLPAPTSAEELSAALQQHGSVRAVAKHYGRDRRQVYRWLEQFGLREPADGE
ncbi:MAG: sigma 54-interacting transcriptional regulator [Myxococcota bacterium]